MEKGSFDQVELHLHLDGAIRLETLLELSKYGQATVILKIDRCRTKGIPMGHATTVEEVKKLLVTHTPANLAAVLQAFEIFLPVIR